ncbi:MAG: hypothetical protein AAF645_27780 [Myxococcota bacterium]
MTDVASTVGLDDRAQVEAFGGEDRLGEESDGLIRRAFGLDRAAFEGLLSVVAAASKPATVEVVRRLDEGASFRAALGLSESAIAHLYAQAFTAFNAGRYARAEELFRMLCILAGDNADHWLGYAVCLRLREAFGKARVACANALKLRPDWSVAHFHLLEIAMREEAFDDARSHVAALRGRTSELPDGMARELARFEIALQRRAKLAPDA